PHMTPTPRSTPLSPYTTLFRSPARAVDPEPRRAGQTFCRGIEGRLTATSVEKKAWARLRAQHAEGRRHAHPVDLRLASLVPESEDRKSTRLNSSHLGISYAVFC